MVPKTGSPISAPLESCLTNGSHESYTGELHFNGKQVELLCKLVYKNFHQSHEVKLISSNMFSSYIRPKGWGFTLVYVIENKLSDLETKKSLYFMTMG